MKKEAIFQIRVQCNDEACEHMNLHLSIASYDDQGSLRKVDHTDATPLQKDTIYRVETSVPSAAVAVSVYAVPQTDPASDSVADNPNFTLTYEIFKNEEKIDTKKMSINRWGGAQIIGLRYE